MASPVGSLVVRIGADIDDLIKGVNKAETQLGKLGAAAKSIGISIAAGLGAAAVATAAFTLKGIQMGDALQEAAEKIGLTASELSSLRYAAQFAGVESGELDAAMARLARTTSNAASGNKAAEETFRRLGLSADELRKLPLDEQLIKVADALSRMQNSTDKARLAQDVFGRSGANLLPLLNQGSDAIRRQTEEARALGLTLDDVQGRVVSEAADAIDRMKSSFEGLSLQLGATFGPVVEAVADLITGITKQITQLLPKLSAMASVFLGIQRAAEDLSNADLQQELNAITLRMIELNQESEKLSAALDKVRGTQRLGIENAITDNLEEQAELTERRIKLEQQVAERMKEAATPTPPPGGGEIEDDGSAERLARDHERKLVAAVKAEQDRLIEIERINLEWGARMAEEAERFHQEEMEQRARWAAEIAAETTRVGQMEIDQMYQKQSLLTQAHNEGVKARMDFETKSSSERVQSIFQDLTQMTAGIAQHSKKAFQVNKLAAVANAVMNTAQGVTKALAAYPPPVSFAMAAAQAAAGAAQISAIKSTQFQGGGTGTTPSAAASPVVNDTPVATKQAAPSSIIRIEGAGNNYSAKQVRELIEAINEQQRDGARLVFVGG